MEPFLVGLNKLQLDKGLDANGSFLGTYKPATYVYAEQAGRPKTRPDINLLDTGNYRNAFMASVIGNSLVVESGDWKAALLEQRFGSAILGLPVDAKQLVADKLIEILSNKVTNVLTNA
jgi:hypothetical protein